MIAKTIRYNMATNNFITHRLGLYKIAYDLSKDGNLINIDYSVSKRGHILVKKKNENYLIMTKVLSKLNPIPISENEFNSLDKFTHIFLITGICTENCDKNYERFSIPMGDAKTMIKTNYSPDGKPNHWIDQSQYSNFKVSKFKV
jgi:hypothetical protein